MSGKECKVMPPVTKPIAVGGAKAQEYIGGQQDGSIQTKQK
jgi:hypothetical protein